MEIDFDPPPFVSPSIDDRIRKWNQEIELFARQIMSLKDLAPAGAWLDAAQASLILGDLKSAAAAARQAKGFGVCPHCDGGGCDRCKNSGFLPKRAYEMSGGK